MIAVAARKYEPCSPAVGSERRVHIIQSEYHVTSDPVVVLTTVLGSCVAACLRDPELKIGGMNHFLLPGQDLEDGSLARNAESFGVHLMEMLVNGLLRQGARRERLVAKLFGGAKMIEGSADIGTRNADFAERFLHHEGISLVGGSLRGTQARRIQYWPCSGRARQSFLRSDQILQQSAAPACEPLSNGSIEFF
ncbi:MAG TPA: chemotaxis protein CheD [Methylocella sp.]|nr:chemotaxis protein CheD [Methylocella sp.]